LPYFFAVAGAFPRYALARRFGPIAHKLLTAILVRPRLSARPLPPTAPTVPRRPRD